MEEKKNNQFFKGFLKNDKDSGQDDAQQMVEGSEANTEEESEQSADWRLHENVAEQNRADTIYQLYCKWCQQKNEPPTDILFSKWMREPMIELEEREAEELAQEAGTKAGSGERQALDGAAKPGEKTMGERTPEDGLLLDEPMDDTFASSEEAQAGKAAGADEEADGQEQSVRVPIPGTEPFIRQLAAAADKNLKTIESQEKKAKKEEEERLENPEKAASDDPTDPIPDIDAAVYFYLPKGNLCALACAFPPVGNGQPLVQELFDEALKKSKIVSGIDEELKERIVNEQSFFKIFRIALGVPAIHGKDGEIIEHIPRQEYLMFEEDETGRVNYRDLNLFRKIKKGDLICDIIAPEDGIDGMDVKGTVLKGKNGKAARVPAGSHTVITPDGSRLVAEQDGYVSFQAEKFRVENRLVINGDVDMSVGNQDFLGDIFIQGDVFSGFTVKATGNVFVSGLVEGAEIIAGEKVNIGSGVNGNNRGTLRAGGDIQSPFMENAKIYAGGDIQVKSMISCEVYCDGAIDASNGIGVLVGGIITAGKSVTAKIIGSKAYRRTQIFLGVMPETKMKRDRKEEELKNITMTSENLHKNVKFLQQATSLTPAKRTILNQLIEQETLYTQIRQRLEAEVDALNEKIHDSEECFVRSGQVYPPAKITIGTASYTLETAATNCMFYLSEMGDVRLGMG